MRPPSTLHRRRGCALLCAGLFFFATPAFAQRGLSPKATALKAVRASQGLGIGVVYRPLWLEGHIIQPRFPTLVGSVTAGRITMSGGWGLMRGKAPLYYSTTAEFSDDRFLLYPYDVRHANVGFTYIAKSVAVGRIPLHIAVGVEGLFNFVRPVDFSRVQAPTAPGLAGYRFCSPANHSQYNAVVGLTENVWVAHRMLMVQQAFFVPLYDEYSGNIGNEEARYTSPLRAWADLRITIPFGVFLPQNPLARKPL